MSIRTGILLSSDILVSRPYIVLATLVALNTTIFAALAVLKLLPRPRWPQWTRRGRTRTATRSIYPEGSDPSGRHAVANDAQAAP